LLSNSLITIAGTKNPAGSDDGILGTGRLKFPKEVAVDASGNVIIADSFNHAIRILPAQDGTFYGVSGTAGFLTTIAGIKGSPGSDDGTLGTGQLTFPAGVAVDASGNVIIADTNNHAIRILPAQDGTFYGVSGTAGFLTTIAGIKGSSGNADGFLGTGKLRFPAGVAVDASGNVIIADTNNHAIRILPAQDGTFYGVPCTARSLTTIAGTKRESGYDDGIVGTGNLQFPGGVALDASGNVIIGDEYNHAIRSLNLKGSIIARLPFNSQETATLNWGNVYVSYFGTTPPSAAFTFSSSLPPGITPGKTFTWSGYTGTGGFTVSGFSLYNNRAITGVTSSGFTIENFYSFNGGFDTSDYSESQYLSNMGVLSIEGAGLSPSNQVIFGGTRYSVGNSFRIDGTYFRGTSPANDITISVTSVNSYGAITGFTTTGTMPASPIYKPIILDFVDSANYVREASEWTSSTREVKVYNEKRADSTINGDGKVEVQQGNQFRLSYLFGKLKTGAAFGGVFNLNGPRSRS